ncbi:MAG: hypothetical protein ACOYUB_02590 [Patescibacteria group bacterium]
MKKETLIAIVFGIGLGGLVALFILIKGKDLEMTKNKVISPKISNRQDLVKPANLTFQSLDVTAPEDGIITDKNSITISGKAEKGSLLVIQSPIKDVTKVIENSDFKIDFPVALGENTIKIVAYPKNKTLRPQEKNLKVYFLDSEL